MNLLHVDLIHAVYVASDLLALFQADHLSHCNTQEPSCRSKKMSYANSSITEEQ
jgi:hypothetical protein